MLTIEANSHDVEVRTALALSAATGCPVHLEGVGASSPTGRVGRRHLAWARAAAAVCEGRVVGCVGDAELALEPGAARSGVFDIAVGTGHSAVDLAWVALPALLMTQGDAELLVRGATHVVGSPAAGWLARSLAPRLSTLGRPVAVDVEQTGFAPGDGRLRVRVGGGAPPAPAEHTTVYLGHLAQAVGDREMDALVGLGFAPGQVVHVPSRSPGNAVEICLGDADRYEVFAACGQRGVPGGDLVEDLASRARAWESSGADLSAWSADAWLVALALAGGGTFSAVNPSQHTERIAEIVEKFIDVEIDLTPDSGVMQVEVRP